MAPVESGGVTVPLLRMPGLPFAEMAGGDLIRHGSTGRRADSLLRSCERLRIDGPERYGPGRLRLGRGTLKCAHGLNCVWSADEFDLSLGADGKAHRTQCYEAQHMHFQIHLFLPPMACLDQDLKRKRPT